MHYLIDGYNLLFNALDTPENLQNKREKILAILQSIFKNLKIEVSVIFDGKDENLNIHHAYSLNIVYTPSNLSADDYILEKLSASNKDTQYTVVTSDRQLAKRCKDLKAKIISVQNFLKWIKDTKKKKSIKATSEFKDTQSNIDRLLKIFEKKLKDN